MGRLTLIGLIVVVWLILCAKLGSCDCNTCKSRPKRVVAETKHPSAPGHHQHSTNAPNPPTTIPPTLTPEVPPSVNLVNLSNPPEMPNLNDFLPATLNATLANISAGLQTNQETIQEPTAVLPTVEDNKQNSYELPSECSCRIYNSTTHICESTTELPVMEMQFETVEHFKTFYEVDDQVACGRACEHWMADHWRADLPICKRIISEGKITFTASLFAKARTMDKWYFIYKTSDLICCENSIEVSCNSN